MKLRMLLIGTMALGSCSGDTPQQLGASAARAEIAYAVFGRNADAHAAKFMQSWIRACELAKGDKAADAFGKFVRSYVDELQTEPAAAARKPLQSYIRRKWWKSGTGCETIQRETPRWALD